MAHRDVVRIDVDAGDCGSWEVSAQREDFVAGAATERQQAERGVASELRASEREEPRISIGLRAAAILKLPG